jgi:hypothetical protein
MGSLYPFEFIGRIDKFNYHIFIKAWMSKVINKAEGPLSNHLALSLELHSRTTGKHHFPWTENFNYQPDFRAF